MSAYSDRILSLLPLAYYRLGEASGTTAVDSSGNGRNGTYAGSPVFGQPGPMPGDPDKAVYFGGSNEWITLPAGLTLPAGNSITVEWWQKIANADVKNSSAFTIGNQASPSIAQANAPWSDKGIYWDYGTQTDPAGRVSARYHLQVDAWVLVHLTFDAATKARTISFNGLEVISSVGSVSPTSPLAGGFFGKGPNAPIKGLVDEFAVYDRVLTRAERLATFQLGRPEVAPPSTDYKGRWDASWPSCFVNHPWGGTYGWQWWLDASGNGRNLGGGDINGYYVPEVNKFQIAGRPAPSWVGTDGDYAATPYPPGGGASQTWFVVGQVDVLTGDTNLLGFNRYGPQVHLVNGRPVFADHWSTGDVLTHPNSVVAGQTFVISWSYNGATLRLRLNGVEATMPWTVRSAGWGSDNGNLVVGQVASGATLLEPEAICFDRTLSAGEITAMESWLSGKWIPPPPAAQTVVVPGVVGAGRTAYLANAFLAGQQVVGFYAGPSAFGTPTVKSAIAKPALGLSSAQAFGTPTLVITGGPQTKAVAGKGSSQAFGVPTVTTSAPPAQSRPVLGVGSPASFGTVTPKATIKVPVAGVPTAQDFGIGHLKYNQTVPVRGLSPGYDPTLVGPHRVGQAHVGYEHLGGYQQFGVPVVRVFGVRPSPPIDLIIYPTDEADLVLVPTDETDEVEEGEWIIRPTTEVPM